MDMFVPGKRVVVQRESTGVKAHATLLGYKVDSFLILELPVVNGVPMFGMYGQHCIVRFMHKGAVFGFRSMVLNVIHDAYPAAFLVVDLPKEFEKVDVRAQQRFGCHLSSRLVPHLRPASSPVTDQLEKPSKPHRCYVIDLNEGGAQIAISLLSGGDAQDEAGDLYSDYTLGGLEKMYAGQDIAKLVFSVPTLQGMKDVESEVEVRWVRFSEDYFFIGLKYLTIEADAVEVIRSVIKLNQEMFTQKILSINA